MWPYFGLVALLDTRKPHSWQFIADEGEYPISKELGDWWVIKQGWELPKGIPGMNAVARTLSDLRLKPQARMVLTHLRKGASITPIKAQAIYSIPRLAACICEIRRLGYPVQMEYRKDERGHRYARYSMLKGN